MKRKQFKLYEQRNQLLEILKALLDPCPLPSKYGDAVKDPAQFEADWRAKGADLIARIEGGK
jgi:hypothetical protein